MLVKTLQFWLYLEAVTDVVQQLSLMSCHDIFLTIAAEECLQPVLHIQNLVDIEDDLYTLQLYMSNRRHTNGGDIKSFNVCRDQHVGTTSVQIVYKDPKGRLDESS